MQVLSEEFLSTFEESAKLFKKYQMAIHKEEPEECDNRTYFSFLVKNPLKVPLCSLADL